MKVIKKLNISAKCFFDQIVKSVQYDISDQTGQSISPSQFTGFEYKKTFGNNQRVTIKILTLEQDGKYQFMTETVRNTFTTSYEIEAIDERSCQVCYTETVTSDHMIQNMNDKLVKIVLSIFKKRRVNKLLQEIERSALLHIVS